MHRGADREAPWKKAWESGEHENLALYTLDDVFGNRRLKQWDDIYPRGAAAQRFWRTQIRKPMRPRVKGLTGPRDIRADVMQTTLRGAGYRFKVVRALDSGGMVCFLGELSPRPPGRLWFAIVASGRAKMSSGNHSQDFARP